MKFFVYGTLKRDYGNNRILQGAEFIGQAVTLGHYKMDGCGAPMVWPHEQGFPLFGEVFDIGEPGESDAAREMLKRLDRLESNGFVYNRVQRPVRIVTDAKGIAPLPRDAGDQFDAWVYEGLNKFEAYRPLTVEFLNANRWLEWCRTPVRRAATVGEQEA